MHMMALKRPKYLAEDVWRIILSKLPVKYVIRCRCVCKTWHHLIGTSSFAKSHLTYQNSASNSNKYMLYHVKYFCTLLTHSQSIYDGTLRSSKLYNMDDIVRRYTGRNFKSKIFGICNGLLCLSDTDYYIGRTIYLWNPTCRKIKKLPQPDDSVIKDADRFYRKASLSFGYYDDDFKVIVIAPPGKAYQYIVAYMVLVYSLNTNSWNMTQIESHDDAYVKGKFYRYRVNETKFVGGTVYIIERGLVRCFDLSNETIRVIPLPKEIGPCVRCYPTNFTTEVYGDSIAIFKFKRESRSLTMWILKDQSSFVPVWEKKLDNIKDSYYYLVGLLNSGKYLVSWKDQWPKNCYLCDLDSPKLREVECMRGSPYICGKTHSNYVESLFLLDEDHPDPIVFYDVK